MFLKYLLRGRELFGFGKSIVLVLLVLWFPIPLPPSRAGEYKASYP